MRRPHARCDAAPLSAKSKGHIAMYRHDVRFRRPLAVLVAAVIGLGLASCENGKTAYTGPSWDEQNAVATEGLARFNSRRALRPGGAQVNDGVFVAAKRVERDPGANLPNRVQKANAVRLESRDPMTLPQIAARLTEITGIPHIAALGPTGLFDSGVDEERDVKDSSTLGSAPSLCRGSDGSLQPCGTSTEFGAQAPANMSPKMVSARVANDIGDSEDATMRPDLQGPLSEVLDEVATTFGATWSYTDGRVLFRDFITRQYQLVALPSEVSSSSEIGADDTSTTTNVDVRFWDEIEDVMAGLAGPGANISLGTGTGIITVTARLSDHERIQNYVDQINESLGRQIAFDVNILTVTMRREDGYGVDISDLMVELGDATVSWTGASTLTGPVGAVNIGVISDDFTLDGVIEALSRQGKVGVQTRTGTTTSNNRMAPIEVVEEVAYVKETQVILDRDGDQTAVQVTPDTVVTGFNLQLLPRILNNREIMVQYTVVLSDLNDIRTFGSGDSQVELPEVARTSFEQQALLENGETLILAGFERTRNTIDEEGVGDPRFFLFGGSRDIEKERIATVILLTPRLLDRRRPIFATARD
ncbi:hypothetical protein HNS03_22055 [Amorphus sp. 3PC139-8]